MKRTVILIDGQNLFFALKSLGIQEKEIIWDKFFKSLLASNDELIRTYWFRPQRILDSYFTAQNVKNQIVYKKFNEYYNDFRNDYVNLPEEIKNEIEEETEMIEDWLRNEKLKFSQIEYNYDQISLEYDDIEIVKTGIVKVNPFLQEYLGEKGVDIALAVKMIALSAENKADKIILVSGDYDYAEAIRYAKDNMTKIHIVKFHKGYTPKNKGVSRDLAVLADKVIDVYESELKENFRKPSYMNV